MNKKKIIAIIPARGGSKGILKKNIHLLAGRPLIHYTIEAAHNSKYIDIVIVSTDNDQIMEVALTEGAQVIKRPSEIAGDDSPTIDTIIHTINQYLIKGLKPEIVVLLQPTSPLRTSSDIDDAITLYLTGECDSVISVSECEHPPYWSCNIENTFLKPAFGEEYFKCQRQEIPKTYMPNGAIYISNPDFLTQNYNFFSERTLPFFMPKERSVDIDSEIDILFAEMIMKNNHLVFQ